MEHGPISPELYARLRRFDPHCEISFNRTSPVRPSPWEHCRRVWVATIRRPHIGTYEMVQFVHPKLTEAVQLVVEEAERRGWARTG